jgi:hypothetical protein
MSNLNFVIGMFACFEIGFLIASILWERRYQRTTDHLKAQLMIHAPHIYSPKHHEL